MEKTREKSFLNIKSKLMAAVAMLLVAFFMVISSSYAWFTLSTAPEVTGITTTVGANGNLEIALLTGTETVNETSLSAAALVIGNGFINTTDVKVRNTYWGNLVDLSDNGYGLNTISLLPSRLDVSEGKLSNYAPILVPEYTADGRVSALTQSGVVQTGTFGTTTFTDKGLGVRALGTKSTMTQQELDYKVAKQAYESALSRAAALTNAAIAGDNAQALVDIIIGYATNTTDFGSYLPAVGDIITKLNGTESAKGVVDYLEDAQKAAIKMLYASIAGSTETYVSPSDVTVTTTNSEDTYTIAIKITVGGAETDISSYATQYAPLKNLCENTLDIKTSLEAAASDYETKEGSTTIDWNGISDLLRPLFDPTNAKLGDYTYDQIQQATAGLGNNEKYAWVITNVLAGEPTIDVVLEKDSGVLADVHEVTNQQIFTSAKAFDFVDTYIMTMMQTTTVSGEGDTATSTVTPYTVQLVTIAAPVAPDTAASPDLTDLYGYALDFAFRTNAANSKLLLSDAANRIYSESNNADTMGKGSIMKFQSSDDAFTATDVAKLMGGIVVVFADKEGNILAIGAADGTITLTTVTDGEGEAVIATNTAYALAPATTVDGGFVTANIVLYNYEFTADGKLILTGKKDSNEITALDQNSATVVSAYVYLNGDVVDNSMVGTSEESMTGSINLQFASDAELKPMDYADLKGQTTTAPVVTPDP